MKHAGIDTFTIVEPLKHKLRKLVSAGEIGSLSLAQTVYGSTEDFHDMHQYVLNSDPKLTPILNLTPLISLGNRAKLESLVELYSKRPFIVATTDSHVETEKIAPDLAKVVPCIIVDTNHEIMRVSDGYGKSDGKVPHAEFILNIGSSFHEIRCSLIDSDITKRLEVCKRLPDPPNTHIQLQDGTSANFWIDLKRFINDPDNLFDLSYEMGYALTYGYSKSLDETAFVVGNNTSYALASVMQSIFQSNAIFMIDKMGPNPYFSRQRLNGLEKLEGKHVCIVEDVVSTGRETDLINLATVLLGGSVSRAVMAIRLDIAFPTILDRSKLVHVCRPSQALGYVRSLALNALP